MQAPTILRILRAASDAQETQRAIDTLRHFHTPLTEREKGLLQKFSEEKKLQLDAGTKEEDIEIPGQIRPLLAKPFEEIPAPLVVQIIFAVSRAPNVDVDVQKVLQRQILPTTTGYLMECPAAKLEALLQLIPNNRGDLGSRTVLRCAEEMLKALSKPIWAQTEPVDDVRGAKEKWCEVLALVLREYSRVHAKVTKRPLPGAQRTSHALFATSVTCKRLRTHLQRNPAVAEFLFGTFARECTIPTRNALAMWVFLTNTRLVGAPTVIPVSIVTTAIKSVHGSVTELLCDTPAIGSLSVEDDAALISSLFDIAALPTITLTQAQDIYTAISALSQPAIAANFGAKPANVLKLAEPFFLNSKCFAVSIASECAARVARRVAPVLDAAAVKTFVASATEALQDACAAGDEKVALLTFVAAVLSNVADPAVLPAASTVTPLLKAALSSPAVELVRAAVAVVTAARAEDAMKAQIDAALKTHFTSEANRRALLTTLPATYDISATAAKLIDDAPEVETFQADAFLAFAFAGAKVTEKVVGAVAKASTMLSFSSALDQKAAAASAIAALKLGFATPFALLSTHAAGTVRKPLSDFLNAPTTTTEQRLKVWAALVDGILGMGPSAAVARPPICHSALPAVVMSAAALLKHSAEAVTPEIVAQMIIASAHDSVLGPDETYFVVNPADLLGRYARHRVNSYAFDQIFTNDFDYLLEKHAAPIVEAIVAALSSAPHVASAAGRSLALYNKRVNEEIVSTVFSRIAALCEASATYFSTLDGIEAAIASGSAAIIATHVNKALAEKGLLKDYAPRPPKGMSEEDYEDLKRKELLALAEARKVMYEDVDKRRKAQQQTILRHLSPFAALRALGRAGPVRSIAIQIVYPVLQSIVSDPTKVNAAIYEFAAEAATALLARTPLRTVAGQMIRLSGLMNALPLTADMVLQATSISTRLRIHASTMMDAPLLVALIPFTRGAFKIGKGRAAKVLPPQAQHQLLNVFVANCGQEDAPQKQEALDVLISILGTASALYRQIAHAMSAIAVHVHESEVQPLVVGMLTGNDLVKESSAQAFSKFAYFKNHLRAQVVAFAMQTDSSKNVVTAATTIASHFTLEPAHWEPLIELITEFAASSGAIERLAVVVKQMITKFPAQQHAWLGAVLKVSGGYAAIAITHVCATVIDAEAAKMAMSFLCDVAENTASTEDAMFAALHAGKEVLSVCSEKTLQAMWRDIQPRLQKPPTVSTGDHKDQHNAIAIVWQTTMAKRLNNTAFLETTIDQQAAVLAASGSAMVHEVVCECMTDIAKHPSVRDGAKLIEFGKNCVKHAINAASYPRKKAHAYGLAGVVAGLGVGSLRRFEVVSAIVEASKEKQAQRSGAMILIEVLADIVGTPFEPYALSFIPQMLDAVSEKDAKISDCADDAAKAVMRNLTDVGLRQLVPLLVRGVQSDQTKKRTPSLGFIGYVAFCSPKQLAATLPSIMQHITECICDANASVANAAFTALRRVAGVVSNPEIQEQVETILAAMRNPSAETENALDALIYTRFMNAVDPASLALILPVVLRGLSERGFTVKGKAAQIVASMVKLVSDPKSLEPYAHELLARLQQTAQDPQAEVRTTSAKAISALASNLMSTIVEDVTNWCLALLGRGNTSAEKAGAAQVLVETIAACGETLLYGIFDRIEAGFKDEVPSVREGFTYILVFSPATMPVKMFQDFLPTSFPWVLRGLSDSNEKVREVALTAGSSIISLYGTRNLKLVLDPLLEGVLSEQTNSRHSSMLLAAKLLVHLVQQIKKKLKINVNDEAEKEEEAEAADAAAEEGEDGEEGETAAAKEIRMESARDAEKKGFSIMGNLEEQLGTESFIRLLAAMHIGRSEHSLSVRTEVTTAWQICVASPRSALNKIFPGIVTSLVKFASSTNLEASDVAQKCIEYTCARLQEMAEKLIDAFAAEYHKGGLRHRIGSLSCMADVIPCTDSARVMRMGGSIVGCVLPALQDEDETVRSTAGILFERISKAVGSRLIESVIESQLESSNTGVLEVVKVRPTASLAIIFTRFSAKSQLTPDNLELISLILSLDQVDEDIPKYYDRIGALLTQSCIQRVEGAREAMTNFAAFLDEAHAVAPITDMAKMMKSTETREGVLIAAAAYGEGLDVQCVVALEAVFKVLLSAIADYSERVATTAVTCLVDLVNGLDKRVIDSLDTAEQADVTASKRAAGKYAVQFLDVFQQTIGATARAAVTSAEPELPSLGFPKMFDTIVSFYTRALDYGNGTQKEQAVECIQELLQFTPKVVTVKAVPTITGKCTKTLFVRNEGPVVAALLRLCLTLMSYPTNSASERMVESALASAVLTPALCDFAEARTLALRIAVNLVRKNPMTADMMLSAVVSKRSSVETGAQKTAMCRFISAVMRHGNVTKKQAHVPTLLTLAKGYWEAAESTQLCAAAASAVGALCNSASVADDELASLVDRALAMAATRSTAAIGAFAALYSFMTSVPARLDESVYGKIAEIIKNSITFGANDRMATLWLLRCITRLTQHPSTKVAIKPDSAAIMLKRTDKTDDQMLATAFFCITELANSFPAQAESLWQFNQEQSQLMIDIGCFDADLEDESCSETTFYK